MVVHRQPEEDHEQQEREKRVDAACDLEAEQLLPVAVLEDEDEDPVGGSDREQVQEHRLRRDHDRSERHQHQQEREDQDEAEHERRGSFHLRVEVLRLRRGSRHADLRAGERADGHRDDLVAERRQRQLRSSVGAVAFDRNR